MKDKQLAPVDPGLGLYLLGVVLHCVSMTVLVYLHYSFGFAFLRPKSFFLVCTWAFGLFTLYAWIDEAVWERQRALIFFGGGSAILYCLHLVVAVVREWRGGGEHDRYGGTSWVEKLAGTIGLSSVFTHETTLHLWLEPAVVLTAAGSARCSSASPLLSRWLFVTAGCVWGKAALNHWLYVRQRKRRKDALVDVEDELEGQKVIETLKQSSTSTSARKARIPRVRSSTSIRDSELN